MRILVPVFLLAALAGAEDGFVGSERCVKCHKKEAKAWRASPHAQHATPVDGAPAEADGAVGSHWMQAYIRRDASGYHRILPKCRDLREERWRDVHEVLDAIRGTPLSGAKSHKGTLAQRSFDLDCSGCHASQARPRLDRNGRMATEWKDLAINCEACHGPGKEHSESWEKLDEGKPLVRLEKLDPRTATAVCTRCHGGPPAPWTYAPEDAKHYIGLLMDRDGLFPDGTASGQVYQFVAFSRSPCHTEGKLTCTGCHDAHGPGLRHAEEPDAMCVRCHAGYASRQHTFHNPARDGARCVSCHMPTLLGGIMAHQRDHRIGSPLPQTPHAPDACTACHKDKDKAWASEAYLKWWGEPPAETLQAIEAIWRARRGDVAAKPLLKRALRHADPFFRANAAIYLGDAEAIIGDDLPEVRRVALHIARGSPPLLQRLTEDGEPLLRGLAWIELSRQGVAIRPESRADLEIVARQLRASVHARLILGVYDIAGGAPARAIPRFEEALAFAPGREEAWRGLATAHGALGQKALARGARLKSAEILYVRWTERPANMQLIVSTAAAFIEGGNRDRAREVLTAALRYVRGREATQVREMLARLEEMN